MFKALTLALLPVYALVCSLAGVVLCVATTMMVLPLLSLGVPIALLILSFEVEFHHLVAAYFWSSATMGFVAGAGVGIRMHARVHGRN